MVRFGRVLLWTVVLVAPGGILLIPVLAATSLPPKGDGAPNMRERLRQLVAQARALLIGLQRHWTKS